MLNRTIWKTAIAALAHQQGEHKADRKTGTLTSADTSWPYSDKVKASNNAAGNVRRGKVRVTAHINAYHTVRGREELCHAIPEDDYYYQVGYKKEFERAMAMLTAKAETDNMAEA